LEDVVQIYPLISKLELFVSIVRVIDPMFGLLLSFSKKKAFFFFFALSSNFVPTQMTPALVLT
jgi:hypothetical protein